MYFKSKYNVFSTQSYSKLLIHAFGYRDKGLTICPIKICRNLFRYVDIQGFKINSIYPPILSSLKHIYPDVCKTILWTYLCDTHVEIDIPFFSRVAIVQVSEFENKNLILRNLSTMPKENIKALQSVEWKTYSEFKNVPSNKIRAYAVRKPTLEWLLQTDTFITWNDTNGQSFQLHPLWVKTRNIESKGGGSGGEHDLTSYILPIYDLTDCNIQDDLLMIETEHDKPTITNMVLVSSDEYLIRKNDVNQFQLLPNFDCGHLCKMWMVVTKNGQPLLQSDALVLKNIKINYSSTFMWENENTGFICNKIAPVLNGGSQPNVYQIYQLIFYNTPTCLPPTYEHALNDKNVFFSALQIEFLQPNINVVIEWENERLEDDATYRIHVFKEYLKFI